MQTKICVVENKRFDEDTGIGEILITTESVDRDDDIVEAAGGDLSNYRNNPVVLADHRYSVAAVVANSLSEQIIPGSGILSEFQFVPKGISDLADLVRGLWSAGFIKTASIGFIPKETEKREGFDLHDWGGNIFKLWELLEWSFVAIPSNPDALALSYQAAQATNITNDLIKILGLENVLMSTRQRVNNYLAGCLLELDRQPPALRSIEPTELAPPDDPEKPADSNTDDDTPHPDAAAQIQIVEELRKLNETIRS